MKIGINMAELQLWQLKHRFERLEFRNPRSFVRPFYRVEELVADAGKDDHRPRTHRGFSEQMAWALSWFSGILAVAVPVIGIIGIINYKHNGGCPAAAEPECDVISRAPLPVHCNDRVPPISVTGPTVNVYPSRPSIPCSRSGTPVMSGAGGVVHLRPDGGFGQ